MSKTKLRILNSARLLFNANGFNQVTIRMIALELGMSSGNLNYHFKTREEILEALYFEMVSAFDQRVSELPELKVSFKQIKNDITTSMVRMLDYQFFWTNLHQLLRDFPKVNAHFQSVYTKRIEGMLYLLHLLNKENWLREEEVAQEFNYLAKRMVDYGNTWLYASQLYASSNEKGIELDNHVMQYLHMLYPYLTKVGKKQFELQILENP